MAMSHSLIYRVCRGGDQCQTVRPGRRTARIKTRSRVSLQKSHTQMSSADTTCVLVPSDPQLASVEVTDLRVAVCVGDDSPRQQDLMIVVAGSTSGAVFTDRTSRMVLASAGVPGVDSMLGPTMAAPLGPAEWNLGVVVVRRTPGSPAFADTDLARLSLFAENAALAVHLAEGQRHRELQVLAERDRISTELYDHVSQQLFGIGTEMQISYTHLRA